MAGQIIPVFGWPSLFFVGGLMPLLLIPVLLIWLPESPRFLVEHESDNDEMLRKIGRKIDQRGAVKDDTVFAHHVEEAKHFPVKALFMDGRASDTLLLWSSFFVNLMVVYFLYSWIPMLLVESGYALSQATKTVVMLNIGGAIAPFVFSKLIQHKGSKPVLTACFFLGALSMMAVGQFGSSLNLVMGLSFFAGFFIVGGQISLNALSSYMYPTHIRSTGVGWANGIGRSGSIIGPLLAGALVTAAYGLNVNFMVFGGLCFLTAIASFFIKNHEKKSESI
jgi:AAHS family 4-hydroxybenzoate transporter-like MFS transporter